MLANCLAVTNAKGGVGKTSITANVAAAAALGGWRTLAVDLDAQGNLARDLGYRERSDEGRALLAERGERSLGAVARSAAGGSAMFFGVMAVFLLPALLFGGGGFIRSFSYHADRGLQLESLGSSVLLKLGYVERVFLEFGAYDVHADRLQVRHLRPVPSQRVAQAVR
jgi:hypothetical protein